MGEINPVTERRPAGIGGTFIGLAVVLGLFGPIAIGGLSGAHTFGWKGGEFARAAVMVTCGSLVLGIVLATGQGFVRGLGRGLLIGAGICATLIVIGIVWVYVAWSRAEHMF